VKPSLESVYLASSNSWAKMELLDKFGKDPFMRRVRTERFSFLLLLEPSDSISVSFWESSMLSGFCFWFEKEAFGNDVEEKVLGERSLGVWFCWQGLWLVKEKLTCSAIGNGNDKGRFSSTPLYDVYFHQLLVRRPCFASATALSCACWIFFFNIIKKIFNIFIKLDLIN